MSEPTDRKPQPGDPCPCGNYYVVVNTRVTGMRRIRYVGCRRCGYRPPNNRIEVGLSEAPKQKKYCATVARVAIETGDDDAYDSSMEDNSPQGSTASQT